MKKALITLVLLGMIITGGLQSQSPPFPNGGNDPGGQTPVGGASPIEGGLLILVSLGAGYSLRKLYSMHAENREKAEN
ncbi:MAG: hypothetical protein ACNA7V_10210 [Bacteroidales bacterium]